MECEIVWSGRLCEVRDCVEWEIVWSGRLCEVGDCVE